MEIFFILHQLKTIAAVLETEYQLFSQQMISDYIMQQILMVMVMNIYFHLKLWQENGIQLKLNNNFLQMIR